MKKAHNQQIDYFIVNCPYNCGNLIEQYGNGEIDCQIVTCSKCNKKYEVC